MDTLFTMLLTLAALGAATYAQWRIPYHTANARHVLISRAVLTAVGLAFGAVMATVYTNTQGWRSLMVFLAGFGLVHVPAAAILFLKRQRDKT